MTSKTRYAVKFGNKAPIPVEKATYHGATLTKAVDEIRARIDEAIEQLAQITSVRKARNKDFSSKLIRKTQRNLYVKIGYGKNNELFSDFLAGFFDCPVRARSSLQEAKEMISAGEYDEEIMNLIEVKRARAKTARLARTQLITKPVTKTTTFQIIKGDEPIIAAE